MTCNFMSLNSFEKTKKREYNPLILRNMTFKKSMKYLKTSTQTKRFWPVVKCLHKSVYIFELAYYSAFDRCKNHFRSTFLSEVANFLLRFSSLSWTNFEKLISGKYKHS